MKIETLGFLFDNFSRYKAEEIHSNFITHDQVKSRIESISGNILTTIKIGESLENRQIYSVRFGKGKRKVLAWSQMHGDEPTATAALFDLFNFLTSTDMFEEIRKTIKDELEIHFIPMLNPDGAMRYQRENAFNIDLNRDAIRKQSDESGLLWNYAEKLKPEFGFNLHDQNSYYTAGRKNKSSAISLLSPPRDNVKSINYVREKSMQVILDIVGALNNFVPEHIARYSDDFEPRAFGDNFTALGISTILIESGFYPGDSEKEFIRKLNFISLISALHSIAKRSYEKNYYANYFQIPENTQSLYDLVFRNLTLKFRERNFVVDIGITRKKKYNPNTGEFYFEGTFAEVGDLSTFYGIEEVECTGYTMEAASLPRADEQANFLVKKDDKVEFEVLNGFIKKK